MKRKSFIEYRYSLIAFYKFSVTVISIYSKEINGKTYFLKKSDLSKIEFPVHSGLDARVYFSEIDKIITIPERFFFKKGKKDSILLYGECILPDEYDQLSASVNISSDKLIESFAWCLENDMGINRAPFISERMDLINNSFMEELEDYFPDFISLGKSYSISCFILKDNKIIAIADNIYFSMNEQNIEIIVSKAEGTYRSEISGESDRKIQIILLDNENGREIFVSNGEILNADQTRLLIRKHDKIHSSINSVCHDVFIKYKDNYRKYFIERR